ncbi:amidase family protein, partial [Roseococcus sp.]|uniref:amidase family protein n=1 Tax=Roseococcus sp. TaxID=2109646 RepID=UPI003BAAEF9D
PASAATLRGIEESCAIFRRLGAEVSDVTLPSMGEFNAAGWVILLAEAWAVHEAWMRERPMKYGELLRARLSLASLLSAGDYIQAQRKRRQLIERSFAAAAGYDLLVTAAAPAEAPKITEVSKWSSLERASFTIPFNVLGWPALSVCTGLGQGDLPTSVQLIGQPWTDGFVLAAGHALERENGTRSRRPPGA